MFFVIECDVKCLLDLKMRLTKEESRRREKEGGDATLFERNQCDQIGRFDGLWATFQSLWQQLSCPNLLHS